MGDCGRVVQLESSAISGAQDISTASDIARRFEQLETQWMSLQKRSEKWEGDKDNFQKATTSSPRNHSQRNAVSCAASSYSNPLFTSHTTTKPSQTAGDETSSASTRTGSPYAGSAMNSERTPSSCFGHVISGTVATSPRDVTMTKDDNLSSQKTPSASMLSSPRQNSGKTFKDGQASPSSEAMYTRATVPSFFSEKPPLIPAGQSMLKASALSYEKHASCASITRRTFRKKTEQRRELKSSPQLPEVLGLQCLNHSASATKSSNRECSRECDAEMIESVHSITLSSSSDPATCSSGKGHPESLGHLGQSNDVHIDQSRNISWRVLGARGVLTEGVLMQDNNPSEVNWELRLSQREAALRIAEETILEEQQNISQARLAVSRCEDALRQREQELQRESEKRKGDMEDYLKSIETGKTVMKTLCTGLKDVLCHLEEKEKVFQDTWLEIKDSVDPEIMFGDDHSFGFEPELSQKDRSATFDSISFLIGEGECEEWCSTVVEICERLVGYMIHETHLQKWATVLEREGMRMARMIKEMTKAKEAASDQCAGSEEMMKCAETQAACMDEERVQLENERDDLILWVNHLQERRETVAECAREAATSFGEVQKKAVDLFVHESNIDEKALDVSALQELRITSQRLQDDQELINREKHKVQEKLRQAAIREREAGFNICSMEKLQEGLNSKAEQLERDIAVDEQRKEKLLLTLQETEGRINAKELSLRELEKEMEQKSAAAEEMTNNLIEREKLFGELQIQLEQQQSRIREMMVSLEKDKVRFKDAEEVVAEAHSSKQSAEEAWTRIAQERQESTEYLKIVEEHLKQWEDRLRNKEKELQETENQAIGEQEHSKALRAKLVQEQESWNQELKSKQEIFSKRKRVLDAKEEEIHNDLERLTEERRVALEDIKRLSEMEERAWGAEKDWQTKHEEHLKEVRKHASEYHSQLKDLELAKREVKKEFEEVRAKKKELRIWQREAEKTLQNRIASFMSGKEELTAQIKELKKLQMDIEQAGSQIIDRAAELDEASTRLEHQRHKVESSKSKLEGLADKLARHQEVLKRREREFLAQEGKLVAVQGGLKKMAADIASKEKNLRSREQAVIDSENDLHDVEARLTSERKDLEKMIAEVEQHVAKLKEETTSVGETSRIRTRELIIEEKREQLHAKEWDLANFETDLRTKAKRLEEHGQTISKLEMQVKERLQKAAEFEMKSEELEKGWERLAIEREVLDRAKMEIQKPPEIHKIQWQMDSDKDETKKKRAEIMEGLRARESAIEAREAKAIERASVLLKMEQQTKAHKDQVENDAQKLRQQLHSARAELEDQRQYVEEKRKATEAIATVVKEREARLKLKEQELAERKATDPKNGHHGGKIRGKIYKQQRSAVLLHNQTNEEMEDRLKHMEEASQKKAAKISQERANLKLQQQDLKETRKAAEGVKLTLTTQLKATKQMVADASLTAKKASREREALEEERKRLAQDQKDAEASLAAKETKLAMEAKQLENLKSMLDQEKAKSMELIEQVAKRAMGAEHANAECSTAQWDSIMLHKEIQCNASLKDKERELQSTANANKRDKTSLREKRAHVRMLHDTLEREQVEHSNVSYKNAAKADTLIKDVENQMAWEEIQNRKSERLLGDGHGWDPTSEGSSSDRSHISELEFSSSGLRCGLETSDAGGNLGEGSDRNKQAYHQLANQKIATTKHEPFCSATCSVSAAYSQTTPEDLPVDDSCRQILEKNGVPSRKRLENVMTSLMHARQASRSRLQRTENTLLAFPPSSGFISQVQQALNTLSARLSLMEQVEDGLENHLRNAYETESPESQGMLDADKMQLLCRMEEQQNSRAEWEEDMQRQLENISMLQAASRSSPNFSTPRVSRVQIKMIGRITAVM